MHAERQGRKRTASWSDYAWATAIVAACVATDWLMQGAMSESDLVMVFLMGVLVVARIFELGPALWAAVLSVAAFDVLFVEPRLTFAVADTRYLITFTVMGGAGVVLAGTTARIRRQAQSEHDRAQRVSVLYDLSRALVGAQDEQELCRIATEHMRAAIGAPVRVLLERDGSIAEPERTVGLELPLIGAKRRLGRVVLDELPVSGLDPLQLDLLKAHAQQLTVAFERAEASAAQRSAELQVEQERMRSSLLSSVSHDLRTPLGVILGATTTLLDETVEPPALQRLELLRTIHGEATRLTRLLENLLQMTKIEGGALVVDKDWYVPEEIVGSALRRVEPSIGTRAIDVRVDPEPSLVDLDGLLIELVLINLLENAARHTPPGTRIQLIAQQDADAYIFDVRDEGPGLSPDEAERVFEKFHRGSARQGAGLGLAICRAIARAHGGDVVASSRAPQRGLSMQLRLPYRPAPADGVAAAS
jgi:two-component system, OmpR family, sensor histidine kinase KdpD